MTNVWYKKIAVIGFLLLITAIYFFFNPAKYSFGIQCFFKKYTGFYCPGCGGQRAFHALLHGHFVEAFQNNLLIFLILPLVVLKIYEEISSKSFIPLFFYSKFFQFIIIVSVLVFTFIRNLNLSTLPNLIPE